MRGEKKLESGKEEVKDIDLAWLEKWNDFRTCFKN
jgi:hypothetical protein